MSVDCCCVVEEVCEMMNELISNESFEDGEGEGGEIQERKEKKISRNLSSFECHEISRLYKHLKKVTT